MRLSYQPLTRRWRLEVSRRAHRQLGPGAGTDLRHAGGGAGRHPAHLALEHRRCGRPGPRGGATTWTSASASTCRSCPGRSRSAPSARPTGSSRRCATSASSSRPPVTAPFARRTATQAPLKLAGLPLGGGGGRGRDRRHRHRAAVPADPGHQQPRAVRAQLRAPVHHQHGGGRRAAAGDPVGRRAAGLAPAPGQVRQPPAGQAGRDLRAGGAFCRAC